MIAAAYDGSRLVDLAIMFTIIAVGAGVARWQEARRHRQARDERIVESLALHQRRVDLERDRL